MRLCDRFLDLDLDFFALDLDFDLDLCALPLDFILLLDLPAATYWKHPVRHTEQ